MKSWTKCLNWNMDDNYNFTLENMMMILNVAWKLQWNYGCLENGNILIIAINNEKSLNILTFHFDFQFGLSEYAGFHFYHDRCFFQWSGNRIQKILEKKGFVSKWWSSYEFVQDKGIRVWWGKGAAGKNSFTWNRMEGLFFMS